jgi:hypothetical protein
MSKLQFLWCRLLFSDAGTYLRYKRVEQGFERAEDVGWFGEVSVWQALGSLAAARKRAITGSSSESSQKASEFKKCCFYGVVCMTLMFSDPIIIIGDFPRIWIG